MIAREAQLPSVRKANSARADSAGRARILRAAVTPGETVQIYDTGLQSTRPTSLQLGRGLTMSCAARAVSDAFGSGMFRRPTVRRPALG